MKLDLIVNERRRHDRRPCRLAAFCTVPASGSQMFWKGSALEVSRDGVRLVVNRRFEVGTTLNVRLLAPEGGRTDTLLARVVHLAPYEGVDWLVECHFGQPLGDGALAVLAADADAGATADRGRTP